MQAVIKLLIGISDCALAVRQLYIAITVLVYTHARVHYIIIIYFIRHSKKFFTI